MAYSNPHTYSNTGTTGTSISVTITTPPTAGQLLVAAVMQTRINATNPVFATPAGWTKIGSTESSTEGAVKVFLAQFYKIADGSETTVAFSLTNAGTTLVACVQEFDGFTGTPTLDAPSVDWINSDTYVGSATNNLLTTGGWTAAGTLPELAVAHVAVTAVVTALSGAFTGSAGHPFTSQLLGTTLGAGWVSTPDVDSADNEYAFMWTTARDCVMQGALFYNVPAPTPPTNTHLVGWNAVANALAGTKNLEAQQAFNVRAGTTAHPISSLGCLNIIAGNGGNPANWRGLNQVCNQIAGTKNLEALHALNVATNNGTTPH